MAAPSNNGTDNVTIRKMGINETYQLAMYLLDQYRGTILSCRYMIPSRLVSAESRVQLEKAIQIAVVSIIMRHPMLQVSMLNFTSKTPSWIQLQSIDLSQHIKWVYIEQHEDFEKIVHTTFRNQLDEYFPDLSIKQPGWKITIIRQGSAPTMEVLLTWNHPHFDGAGARVLQEELVDLLNIAETMLSEPTGLEGNILRLPESTPMLPTPIEDLRSLPLDFKYFAKTVWEEFRPGFLNRDPSLAAWCPIRSNPYKTQYRSFFIDNASLHKILAKCRVHKTTITGLLHGLALIAFSAQLDSKTAPAFQSSTIVDHRRNLPPAPADAPWVHSDRAVANYVTQLPHTFDTKAVARVRAKLPPNIKEEISLSPDLQIELWAASAQNRLELVRKLETGLRNDIVGIFKWVTDWQKTMSDMAKRPRQFTWLVTNIGVLNGNYVSNLSTAATQSPISSESRLTDDQRWSITRAEFGLSTEIPAAAMEFSAVSVAKHGMCVSAMWPDCALDVAFGERIVAIMERWLNQLANEP